MKTTQEELAHKVLTRDGEWGMTGSLQAAKSEIALRGHDDLDDLTQKHIRVLALLCSGLPWKTSTIELYFPLDSAVVAECVSDLCDLNYAEQSNSGYQATALGAEVLKKIGIEMLGMDRFRMEGELQASERLLKKLR